MMVDNADETLVEILELLTKGVAGGGGYQLQSNDLDRLKELVKTYKAAKSGRR